MMPAPSSRAAVVTLGLAGAGGLLGEASGLPAGALLGALMTVAAYNLSTDGAAQLPAVIRDTSRILVGTVIGSLVTPALLSSLGVHLPWAVLFTALIILAGLMAGWLLARLTGLDMPTALLSCSPGGMPEMSALASELGARVDVVLGIHVIRKIIVLIVVPLLVLQLTAR